MPFDTNDSTHTFNINGDTLQFTHSKDDTCHIVCPEGQTLGITNETIFEGGLRIDTLKSSSGNAYLEYDNFNEVLKTRDDMDFSGSTNVLGLKSNVNVDLAINPTHVESNDGYANLDAELNARHQLVTEAHNRTNIGATASGKNAVYSTNGNLTAGSYSETNFIRNNNTAQQELLGDLNLASGKLYKIGNTQISSSNLSDGGSLATTTQLDDKVDKSTPTFVGLTDGFAKISSNVLSGGNSIVDADLPSTITRDTEVNSLATDKVNKSVPTFTGLTNGFAKITNNVLSGGNTITDSDIPSTITRDTEVNSLATDKVDKATPTFTGLSDGFAKITSNVLSGGNSIVDGDIPSTITRDTEVNSLATDKVNKAVPTFTGLTNGFAKITNNVLSGGNTIADSDIPSTITRDTEVNSLATEKVNKSNPTFSGVDNGIAFINSNVLTGGALVENDIPAEITRNTDLADYLKKDGTVSMTGALTTTQVNITDANHKIEKDGNGDIVITVPTGDIHKFKIGTNTIASIDAGGIDLSSGKEFSINGTAVTTADPTKLPLAGGTMTGTISFDSGLGLNGFAKIISNSLTAGFITNVDVPNLSSKTFTTSTLSGTTTLASGHAFSGSLKCDGSITLGNGNTGINFGDDGKPIISAFDNNLFFQTKNSGNDIIIKTFQASTTTTTNSVMFRDDYMEIDDGYALRLNNVAGGNFIKTNSSTKQLEAGTIADGDIPNTIARLSAPTFTGTTTIPTLRITDKIEFEDAGYVTFNDGAGNGNMLHDIPTGKLFAFRIGQANHALIYADGIKAGPNKKFVDSDGGFYPQANELATKASPTFTGTVNLATLISSGDITTNGDLHIEEGGKIFFGTSQSNEPSINEYSDSLFMNIKSTAPNYSRIAFTLHNSSNSMHEALQLIGGSAFNDAHFRNGFGIKMRGGDFVKYNSDTVATTNEIFKITDSETTINNTVKLSNIFGNRILKTDVNKNVIGVNTLTLDDMPTTQPTWSTLSVSTGLSTPKTFGTSNSSFSPYPPFSYAHVGNKIFLRGEIGKDSGNFSSGTLLATLPSNKTPTYNQIIAMPGINAGNDELVVYGNNYDSGFGTSFAGQIYYFTADTNGFKFVVPANTYFFLD